MIDFVAMDESSHSVGEKQFEKQLTQPNALSRIEQLIDAARWAPSGDNAQPWYFKITGEDQCVMQGVNIRKNIYDLNGEFSLLAMGAALENLGIAGSEYGLKMNFRAEGNLQSCFPRFHVTGQMVTGFSRDPLALFIRSRSVQRRAMSMRRLTSQEKTVLEDALPPTHRVVWLEGAAMKAKTVKLMFDCAGLRLKLPEAYPTHVEAIQWRAQYSESRIPDQALGLDPLTVWLMRRVMRSWRRVHFFNRFMAGSLLPRIEMDLIPHTACAGHFMIVAQDPPKTLEQHVQAGRCMQRFWLTATMLGLQLQPAMAPVNFSRYVRQGLRFSEHGWATEWAKDLSRQLVGLVGADHERGCVFMGRIGAGPPPRSRSLRHPLSRLVKRLDGA